MAQRQFVVSFVKQAADEVLRQNDQRIAEAREKMIREAVKPRRHYIFWWRTRSLTEAVAYLQKTPGIWYTNLWNEPAIEFGSHIRRVRRIRDLAAAKLTVGTESMTLSENDYADLLLGEEQ